MKIAMEILLEAKLRDSVECMKFVKLFVVFIVNNIIQIDHPQNQPRSGGSVE